MVHIPLDIQAANGPFQWIEDPIPITIQFLEMIDQQLACRSEEHTSELQSH